MGKEWKQWKQCQTLFFWAPKSLQMVTAAMKLKDAYSLEGKLWPTSSQVKSLTQLCPTLCNPVDCSPPGSFVCGILQARILEWVAISFSRASSRHRDRTQVFCIAGRRFNLWATREALIPTIFKFFYTNLGSILKSRDITLPTKVRLVKAIVFPVVMYGCESWTIKKAENQRIEAFELWFGEDSWESLGHQGDQTSKS